MKIVVTRLIVDFSEEQMAIIDKWMDNYLSYGVEPTRANAIRDMIGKIYDDMRDMEED
jgi:hypothetical protein